jgi:hypothetical protein
MCSAQRHEEERLLPLRRGAGYDFLARQNTRVDSLHFGRTSLGHIGRPRRVAPRSVIIEERTWNAPRQHHPPPTLSVKLPTVCPCAHVKYDSTGWRLPRSQVRATRMLAASMHQRARAPRAHVLVYPIDNPNVKSRRRAATDRVGARARESHLLRRVGRPGPSAARTTTNVVRSRRRILSSARARC